MRNLSGAAVNESGLADDFLRENIWFLFLISANIFEFLRTMWLVGAQWGARVASVLCVERAARELLWKYLENIEFKRSQPVWGWGRAGWLLADR